MDELYENLYDFIKNLEILIQKNVSQNQHQNEIRSFGNQLMNLCKSKELNVTLNDIQSLNSYSDLCSKAGDYEQYLSSRIENFYFDIIEPTKTELYG
ncbi:hypothetical protein [Streptococcus himalayensis]|uniref:Uncharacterized protein n=1 Tax=Streptococcus himalayensis TaxID=1888195 RepID=A0A917A816_9STRE|nr:hypothetical protein [Streptococcus himalayensis]GGE34547.1 hypothetical protein GCM10011510_14820 [Streptococcus himalayensis]